jgi:molecular chaperone DnaK
VPQIEVSFDIDANGILEVSAKDMGTGKEHSIKIQSSSGLSEEEVESMRQDAERFADEDKATRELVEIRNEADQACYATESSLKDHSDKMEGDEVEKIEKALEALKEAKSDAAATRESIRVALDGLNEASHDLARRIYEQASPEAAAEGATAAPGGAAPGGASAEGQTEEEPIVDADFTVKD